MAAAVAAAAAAAGPDSLLVAEAGAVHRGPRQDVERAAAAGAQRCLAAATCLALRAEGLRSHRDAARAMQHSAAAAAAAEKVAATLRLVVSPWQEAVATGRRSRGEARGRASLLAPAAAAAAVALAPGSQVQA